MSVEVVAWPPFGITAWEIFDNFPQSRSVATIQGSARTSSALLPRRLVTATAQGIGPDESGAGFVRMLNRRWAGKPRLVRMECYSALWRLSPSAQELAARLMAWTIPSTPLLWTSGGVPLGWGDEFALIGAVATDGVWPAISVSGLPPNVIVARPSDLIEVTSGDGLTKQLSRALKVTRSDASGVALIRLETAFSIPGSVAIGVKETGVFEAQEVPRGSQPLSGDWLYQWSLREVFAEEYVGGFTEVDPWR